MWFQQSTPAGQVLDNATTIGDVVWESINSLFTSIVERLPYLIAGAIVLVLFYLAAILIRKIFWSTSKRTRLDERLRILFSRLIVVFVVVLGLFTALTIIIPSFAFGDFIAGLGLTSLAIGFATKDILNHLISGVMILWQQPFRIGDHIVLKDDEGRVEYIGVRATSLKRANGEVILIPNGDIYSSPFRVRRAGASYPLSLKFALGYDVDLSVAKRIARDTLVASTYVVETPEPKVIVTALESEGVKLSANFRIDSTENRPNIALDSVASDLVAAFRNEQIAIYPPAETLIKDGGRDDGDRFRDRGDVRNERERVQ